MTARRWKDLEPEELLGLRPVRRAEHEERDGRVVIERPLPPVTGLRTLLRRISALTGVRRLRLDERGSFVWLRIDGGRTVDGIARELLREGPPAAADSSADAEGAEGAGGPDPLDGARRAVVLFLRMLARQELVELRDPAGQAVKL